ncbi:MAG TPA: hypothetical protein VFQ68_26285 [Streptosporangiaceae bacterium]|nr:hypothetical protein [Streptosporangiaceae bacterium]
MPDTPVLMVPIHLDALVLGESRPAVGALADFTRLPYPAGDRDVNSDIGYLSEAILADPLANQGLRLAPGVHLHWALPDALTRAGSGPDGMAFPAVPDRWLVLRGRAGQEGHDAGWVVESDYLHPAGATAATGSVAYPVAPGPGQQGAPYRYLGRAVPLASWTAADPGAERLTGLTAVGYGEPAFAAFYPNCLNVFGLHDGDAPVTDDALRGLRYDVLGWYSDRGRDYLANLLRAAAPGDPLLTLREVARWTVGLPADGQVPARMACYGRLTFAPAGDVGSAPPAAAPVTIAVGNSGPEALCAYLADAIGGPQAPATEEQLEAMLLAPRLEQGGTDLATRFGQALHEAAFVARPAGSLWTLRQQSAPVAANAVSAARRVAARAALPADLAPVLDRLGHALNELNRAQQAYDRATDEIGARSEQLFLDWYRYMLCAYPPAGTGEDYPDIDGVRRFIERRGLPALRAAVQAAGLVVNVRAPGDDGPGRPGAADGDPASLAAAVATAADQVEAVLADLAASPVQTDAGLAHRLAPVEAPRYWEPAEPVVLLAGDTLSASVKHGQDGRLRADGLLGCQAVASLPATPATAEEATALARVVGALAPPGGQEQIGYHTWTSQDWHPLLMAWEVEVWPAATPPGPQYPPGFLTDGWQLADDEPELRLRDGHGALSPAGTVHTGASILTPYAQDLQVRRLAGYVKGIYQRENQRPAMPEDDVAAWLAVPANIEQVQQWLATKPAPAGPEPDPVATALAALLRLQVTPSLSQSLGGFNDALLTRRRTLQLDVADPLGFDDYRAFTAGVRPYVQGPASGQLAAPDGGPLPPYLSGHNRTAPQPLGTFQPVRSGAFRVVRLRLLDAFGRVIDLHWDRVIASRLLPATAAGDLITLPPRFVQPARLNFRWLSADLGDQQLTELATHSPVCGWLLPNHFAESLAFYQADGTALGSIDRAGRWQFAPGAAPVSPDQVADPHLKAVIDYLIGKGSGFLQNFHGAVDSALENIDPPNLTGQPDTAVLVGRPLAVVRASVDLQLQGLPAADQTWTAFRHDLRSDTRQTAGFTGVAVPVRIGDYRQLSDGLVGYWVETPGGFDDVFNAPLSDPVDDPGIRTHAGGEIAILQSPDSPAQTLTMLVDPRGSLHATCGVLPVKTISIPAEQYADGLGRIEVTFPAGPILSSPRDVEVALPAGQEDAWSWVEATPAGWRRTWTQPVVDRQSFLDGLARALWDRLTDRTVQWLRPVSEDPPAADVVAVASRVATSLAPWPAGIDAALDQILARASGARLTLADFAAAAGPAIGGPAWDRLLDEDEAVGWLSAAGPEGLARVTVGEAAAVTSLPDPLAGLEAVLRSVLDLTQRRVRPPAPAPGPHSAAAQQIREGWLALRRLEGSTS